MKLFYLLAISSLLFVFSATTFADRYSASCGTALEKLHKARKSLIPVQRSMEQARSHERVALAETLICEPGDISSAARAQRCSQARWEALQWTQDTLEAEAVYLQGRQVVAEQLEWTKQVCLLEP